MKIAFVLPGGTGGGVRSVTRIASGLIERGHSVLVLHRRAPRNLRETARDLYLALRYRRNGNWLRTFGGRSEAYDRLTLDNVGRNDVVIGVGVDSILEVAKLPRECGTKVFNSRGIEAWQPEREARAWALSLPSIVNGSHIADKMAASGCAGPVIVAHNGVDRSQYFPVLPDNQRDGVGTVYHGGAIKDPGLILEVLRGLRRQRPRLPLYVFGGYPRPRGLPAGTRYVRFPSLDAVRTFYSRAKVWFLASRNEGLPNPVLEAMACGCSVVSTNCGGPGDIIASGTNGFLTPVGDAGSMSGRILQLLDDEPLRQRFVHAATPVLDHFTWPRAVEAFESALKDILAGATDAAIRSGHPSTPVGQVSIGDG
jgi:glycosyltransferase involved in cell wall biosynthesis